MRVIIAGSRTITDSRTVEDAITKAHMDITELVSGGAKGVDQIGIDIAKRYNIPVKLFIPEWGKYGKSAGPLRNRAMAQYAQGLIAIWNRQSRGTKDMIDQARLYGLQIYIHEI